MGEPLSRVEAILQNILGADNILVPPGSQVEEILQAIYYNTEYEKNPKSRVAEILLAIKNKGVYDGPVLSRVEDILVHKLNNIPYTKHKKEDLSRVEQLLLDWLEQGGGEEIIEYTGTFPMTILANGEPLLDYIISGNAVQDGIPTSGNPIMPEGTGDRTGNLYNINAKDVNNGYVNNAQLSQDGTTETWGSAEISEYIPISGDTAYTFNGIGSYNSPCYGLYDENKQLIGAYRYNGAQIIKFTSPNNARYFRFTHIKTATLATRAMMVEGAYTTSTMPDYEPYGVKIPISSANTTTPVYLGEVQTTRKIKKLVLTGEENWTKSSAQTGRYNLAVRDYLKADGEITSICTHFNATAQKTGGQHPDLSQSFYAGSDSTRVMFIHDAAIETLADFKAYLAAQYAAGTPVCVWYVLATPTTGIVNEPLMKIGDYTDTLSYAQAGVDVPTNEKPTETVVDVPTSVKPSEGYIKYTEPTDGPTPKTQVLGTKNHEIYMTSNDEVYVLRR